MIRFCTDLRQCASFEVTTLRIIPVIDVKEGLVVHACGGDRSAYQPIVTPLAASAQPDVVITGLRTSYRFTTLYVADLDGITLGRPDLSLVADIVRRFPDLEVWVDNGAFECRGVQALLGIDRVKAVIGSETLNGTAEFERLRARFGERIMLSLDFKADVFDGPRQLLQQCRLWPETIIAMTLAAVGAKAGPDLDRIRWLKAAAPSARVVAAGGVRDKRDLVALAEAGADAVLVATALHAGTLKAGDLGEVAGLRLNSKCS